jgi:hypothetical protein
MRDEEKEGGRGEGRREGVIVKRGKTQVLDESG